MDSIKHYLDILGRMPMPYKQPSLLRELNTIMEGREEYLLKTFGEKIAKRLTDTHSDLTPEALLDKLSENDPTGTKKSYLQWLVTLFVNGNLKPEDAYKAKDDLTVFEKWKGQLPQIVTIKTLPALHEIIEPFREKKTQGAIKKEISDRMAKESEVVYNDSEYKIVIPKTKEASKYFVLQKIKRRLLPNGPLVDEMLRPYRDLIEPFHPTFFKEYEYRFVKRR